MRIYTLPIKDKQEFYTYKMRITDVGLYKFMFCAIYQSNKLLKMVLDQDLNLVFTWDLSGLEPYIHLEVEQGRTY